MLSSSAAQNTGVVRIVASRDAQRSYQKPLRHETVIYTNVVDILNGDVSVGQIINICGVVKDAQLPIKSRGTDWKMTLRISDESSEASASMIGLHLFAKSDEDLPLVGALDVMYIHKARVQIYAGSYSLLSNENTHIFVYPRAVLTLPQPSAADKTISTWTRQTFNGSCPVPNNKMTTDAVALFKQIQEMLEATGIDVEAAAETVEIAIAQSTYSRGDKRCKLKDVRAERFHDLLVRVVTEPQHARDELAMIWVSDYTVNEEFADMGKAGLYADFDTDANGSATDIGTIGDENGYLDKHTVGKNGNTRGSDKNKADDKWTGPVGRRSMMVSCFDEHANTIKTDVKRGDWVKLLNVQIRRGRNDGKLEGFLRGDRNAFRNKNSIEVLDMDDLDLETMDSMHRDGIMQLERYEWTLKMFHKDVKKRQLQQQKQAQKASKKRAAEDETAAENSRQRRRRMRMQKEGGGSVSGNDEADNANNTVVAECGNLPQILLADISRPAFYQSLVKSDGTELPVPFANFYFSAKVRVVDFSPKRVADFAVSRYVGPLERAGGVVNDVDFSSSDDDDDAVVFGANPRPKRDSAFQLTWEWRFALQLEDATDADAGDGEKPRIWAVVGNAEGRALTGMDACDLKKPSNNNHLKKLQQKMFLLWGNLEEIRLEAGQRAAEAEKARRDKKKSAAEAVRQKEAAVLQRRRERAQREQEAQEAAAQKAKLAEEARAQQAQKERERIAAIQSGKSLRDYQPDASSDAEPDDEMPQPAKPSELSASGQGQLPDAEDEEQELEVLPPVEARPEVKPEAEAPVNPPPVLSNRPFMCCLRQFGILARVEPAQSTDDKDNQDDDMSDDDNDDEPRREWRQMFNMFGTRIR